MNESGTKQRHDSQVCEARGFPRDVLVKLLKSLGESLDLWTDRHLKNGVTIDHCCSGLDLVAWFAQYEGRFLDSHVRNLPEWLFANGFLCPVHPSRGSKSGGRCPGPSELKFSCSNSSLYKLHVDMELDRRTAEACKSGEERLVAVIKAGAMVQDRVEANETRQGVFRCVDAVHALVRYLECPDQATAWEACRQLLDRGVIARSTSPTASGGFAATDLLSAPASPPAEGLAWTLPPPTKQNSFLFPNAQFSTLWEQQFQDGGERDSCKEELEKTLRMFAWAELQDNGNTWQLASDETSAESIPFGATEDFDAILEHTAPSATNAYVSYRTTAQIHRTSIESLQELYRWGGHVEKEVSSEHIERKGSRDKMEKEVSRGYIEKEVSSGHIEKKVSRGDIEKEFSEEKVEDGNVIVQLESNAWNGTNSKNMLNNSAVTETGMKTRETKKEADRERESLLLMQASARHWDTFPGFKSICTRVVSVPVSKDKKHHPGRSHLKGNKSHRWLFRRGSNDATTCPTRNTTQETTKKHFLQDHSVSPFGTYMMIQVPVSKQGEDYCSCSQKQRDCCCFCALATVYLVHPLNKEFAQLVILHQCARKHAPVSVLHSLQQEILNFENFARVCKACAADQVVRGESSPAAVVPTLRERYRAGHQHGLGIEDFELLHIIGRGGYGKVFVARARTAAASPHAGQLVAIKALKKKKLEKMHHVARTLTERSILSELRHPGIVRLFSAFTCDSRVFMVLEYVPGGDLFTRLRVEVQIPEARTRLYIAETVLALEYLHAHGVVYRDLKPENVLITAEGHVKLTDFGLSRGSPTPHLRDVGAQEPVGRSVHCRRPSLEALRLSNSFCGTEIYMAPEVLLQTGHGAPVDWWCVGLLLCELLTGRHPFRVFGDHYKSLQNIVSNQVSPTMYCDVPSQARSLVEQLLQKNPRHRIGSGADGSRAIKEHPFFMEAAMKVSVAAGEKDPAEQVSWTDFLREVHGEKTKWDWDHVFQRAIPEYLPPIRNDLDVSNFEKRFTELAPSLSLDTDDGQASGCWSGVARLCGAGAEAESHKLVRPAPRFLFLKRFSIGQSTTELLRTEKETEEEIPDDDFRTFSFSRPASPGGTSNSSCLPPAEEAKVETGSGQRKVSKSAKVVDGGTSRVEVKKPIKVFRVLSRASSIARTVSRSARRKKVSVFSRKQK